MLNLLRADRIKLQGGRKFWSVAMIMLVLPFFQLLNSISKDHYQGGLHLQVDQVINGATGVLMPLKSNLLILLIFCAFISFYIGEEFQSGTIRNALSLGVSRLKYYSTKLVIACELTLGAVILVTGLSMIGFGSVYGFGEVAGVDNYGQYFWLVALTLFLLIFSVVAVYVEISFMLQSVGVAMMWSFIFTIAMGFIPGIFQKFDGLKSLTWWFSESYLFYTSFTTPDVLNLVPKMITVSVVTILIASGIGYAVFNRSDIK
ncbi:hypothetical protein FC99_GL001082 [Levilactobacillus koreensis JCM 16448]|uniref:ABC transporter permease n=1 Tax=Levilactobacillus koreensis TaxID=637971 RepID=A0AAC8ZH55_9LACO|nr:ABC transporter permease [Levilactobacillus koreensis]AKP65773.1 hypothetical protein ABN16_12665 [Levilactobacillus koreensis]KRK87256.1 hypothetical protein FC99_GL001082 [Levilactobacillus koreensis JCM 16448]